MARFNLRFTSKYLLRKTEVNLVIPSLDLHGSISNKDKNFYQSDDEKFPLIILMSGFGDDNEAWLYRTDIAALCDKYRVAAAMISGENKWYVNSSPIDNWHGYITEELPDFLYGNFSRLDGGKPIIGGVSMGGYGALYNGLKNAEGYRAIFALSPAVKPDDYIDESKIGTLKELFIAAKDKLPYTYISVGDKDFIYNASREFSGWLKQNIGIEYNFVAGYGHVWELWAKEIENLLQQLKTKKII